MAEYNPGECFGQKGLTQKQYFLLFGAKKAILFIVFAPLNLMVNLAGVKPDDKNFTRARNDTAY